MGLKALMLSSVMPGQKRQRQADGRLKFARTQVIVGIAYKRSPDKFLFGF
jgi:hypothetical protein